MISERLRLARTRARALTFSLGLLLCGSVSAQPLEFRVFGEAMKAVSVAPADDSAASMQAKAKPVIQPQSGTNQHSTINNQQSNGNQQSSTGNQQSPVPQQSQNPLEPSGFPNPIPREGELPTPHEGAENERILQFLEPYPEVRRSGNHIKATGGVHALYKGYDMFGSTLEGDTQTQVFTLDGDVLIVGKSEIIRGRRVTVDYRARTFIADNTSVDMKPDFLQGRTLADVYYSGQDLLGSEREQFGDNGSITTCDYDDPHYAILAEKIDVRPTKRIIFRGVKIDLLGHVILRLPYLSLPLDRRSQDYLPSFGHSPDEGYWIKFKIPIDLKGNDKFLDTRVEYFTKLGPALGLDYNYYGRLANGSASVYGLFNNSTFTGSFHHDQRIGPNELTLDTSYQRSNYLTAPNNTLWDFRGSYLMPQRNGSNDRFFFDRSSNTAPGFSTIQQTMGLSDSRVFSQALHTDLDVTMVENKSTFSSTTPVDSKELDVKFMGLDDLKRAIAELDYQRNIPIGRTTNLFTNANQTPVFTLRSDASRLLGQRAANDFPFQTDVSFGDYSVPSLTGGSMTNVVRSNFDFNFAKPDHPERPFDISFDGRFQQGVYSDQAAQYVTGTDFLARYNLARDSALNLRYSYLQSHGYSPIQFDQVGQTNVISADLSYKLLRSLNFGAQSAYDFVQLQQGTTPWQSVGARMEYRPFSYLQFRTLATYDTFQRGWSNVRFDMGYKPGATFVALGAQYDGIRHTIGDLNLYVDGFTWGRLKTSMILDYDGYTKQFTSRHFSFTYDLHCAELIVQILNNNTGFRPGTQVAVFLTLKAFPFTTPFGIGTRGQAVGGGTGYSGF